MLKLLLIFLFCTFYSIGFSQLLPSKGINHFKWKLWELAVVDSVKLDLVSKIIESNYFDNYTDFPEERNLKNYHLIDFTGNGLTDIIYNGRNPPGLESNNVSFFLNNGDSLNCIAYFLGDISFITRLEKSQPISFQIIQSPCCAQFLFSITSYIFSDTITKIDSNLGHQNYYGMYSNESKNVIIVDSYSYPYKIKFPDVLQKTDTIFLERERFFTPKPMPPSNIDFTVDETYFHFENNKAMAELKIGQKCIILHEFINNNNDVYYFVILKNESKEKNYCQKIKHFQYGWIKK